MFQPVEIFDVGMHRIQLFRNRAGTGPGGVLGTGTGPGPEPVPVIWLQCKLK